MPHMFMGDKHRADTNHHKAISVQLRPSKSDLFSRISRGHIIALIRARILDIFIDAD